MKKDNCKYTLKMFFADLFNDDLVDFFTAIGLIILSPFIIIFSPVIKFFVWKKDYENNYTTEANNEFKKDN